MALIVVVEDNADLREMYEEILSLSGYSVRSAETVAEVMAIAGAERPAAVVLDLGIKEGGDAVVHALRQDPSLAAVPVVLASGARDLAEKAAELGAAAWLQKPFTQEALLEALARVEKP